MTLERKRSESEVKLAKLIQEEFFSRIYPPTFRSMNFLIILFSLICRICRRSFYDFINLDTNQLVIVLGDGKGKGVWVALFMARLMSDIRYVSYVNRDPVQVISNKTIF